jgi:hypothetical protein
LSYDNGSGSSNLIQSCFGATEAARPKRMKSHFFRLPEVSLSPGAVQKKGFGTDVVIEAAARAVSAGESGHGHPCNLKSATMTATMTAEQDKGRPDIADTAEAIIGGVGVS